MLYDAGGSYDNWRRNVDYYAEGDLLWLEIDETIRMKTGGKKTLNDFIAAFEGLDGNTPPKVVPYTFEDIVSGLNAVVPNDWATFLRTRLDSNDFHAPEIAGINALSGYKLTFSEKPNYWSQLMEADGLNATYSLGLTVNATGTLGDVIVGGVAYKAGLAPGFQIIAVNGRGFTPGLLRAAIDGAKGNGPAINLIVENTGYFKTVSIDYHDGERYPQLDHADGVPDRLDNILQPLTK
jgi:predicted metalloprotease with PDZ domain